ncbi:MAG TPA: hypothetical protein VKV06_06845 [Acidimicrobiales bacterium]|nr:hypothetical protein [Acidimicrobiales bacterium]
MSVVPGEDKCPQSGKVQYRSRQRALTALTRARRSSLWYAADDAGGVYQCPYCDFWHLTSRPSR